MKLSQANTCKIAKLQAEIAKMEGMAEREQIGVGVIINSGLFHQHLRDLKAIFKKRTSQELQPTA